MKYPSLLNLNFLCCLEIVEKIMLSFKLFVNLKTSFIMFINKVIYSEMTLRIIAVVGIYNIFTYCRLLISKTKFLDILTM